MTVEPKLDARTAAANMADIAPRFSPQEALVEAARCLYCFDAPCIASCPTGIDVPGFIGKIAHRSELGAARTILRANVLGASCARVCPTEVLCEGACVLNARGERPVAIGRLQRFATDALAERAANAPSVLSSPRKRSGKKVAVIGAGPAGLACAAELAQLGHTVVIHERRRLGGGLNTYGIAYYKMKPEVSLAEVELVRGLGVEIREGSEVGSDVTVETLRTEHDAIFLGVGLGRTAPLGIPGEELPEVFEALRFIEELRMRPLHDVAVGERVVVIGCGNTAIDAVTQAKRLGAAQALIVYRRGAKEMSAYRYEYELARQDGVEFLFHTRARRILGDEQGHVRGLELVRTMTDPKTGGLVDRPGASFELSCDMVIEALGQDPGRAWLESTFPELEIDARGVIARDFATGRTGVEGIWAGGDAANGGSEVVDAVAEGRRAARDMHRCFTGESVRGPVQTTRYGAPGGACGSGFDRPVRIDARDAEPKSSRKPTTRSDRQERGKHHG